MDTLNNLPPFYVGQIANCVNGAPSYNLITGNKYKITGVTQCPCCKKWYVSWGEKAHTTNFSCCDHSQNLHQEYFALSSRFRREQQTSFPLMTFEKIKEKEEKEVLILN